MNRCELVYPIGMKFPLSIWYFCYSLENFVLTRSFALSLSLSIYMDRILCSVLVLLLWRKIITVKIVKARRQTSWPQMRPSHSPQEGPTDRAIQSVYNTSFNTNRVYESILIATNGTSINVNIICIWIGIPKPHLRRFRLAAVFVNDLPFWTSSTFVDMCKKQCLYILWKTPNRRGTQLHAE